MRALPLEHARHGASGRKGRSGDQEWLRLRQRAHEEEPERGDPRAALSHRLQRDGRQRRGQLVRDPQLARQALGEMLIVVVIALLTFDLWHVAMQQHGFGRIYAAKAGDIVVVTVPPRLTSSIAASGSLKPVR